MKICKSSWHYRWARFVALDRSLLYDPGTNRRELTRCTLLTYAWRVAWPVVAAPFVALAAGFALLAGLSLIVPGLMTWDLWAEWFEEMGQTQAGRLAGKVNPPVEFVDPVLLMEATAHAVQGRLETIIKQGDELTAGE